jgi:D-psicose/D-tagatose/L-ribulose 3-epimerase
MFPEAKHMKLGVNTLIWSASYDNTVEAMLPAIREHGFDGIEIPIFAPSTMSPARVRRALTQHALECNVVSILPNHLSLITDDAAIRRQTIQWMTDLIATTAECGAEMLVGPLYCPVGFLPGRRRTADEWSRAIDAYQQLGEMLTQHNITLAIEPLNRFETFFLNTAADAAALATQVNHPNIGILYDTFHANIEEKDIPAGLLTIGRHLKLIHTCENDRGTPGSGHIDWPGLFSAIAELNYEGWLTIESFGFDLHDLCAAAAIWRDIESTPSTIAFEGVRFLRQHLKANH